jgi:hypothetical protein
VSTMLSTDGNFTPPSPPSAIYWTNLSRADNLKNFCDWLKILRPGWCQV